jgi:hypothetical protein
VIQTEQLTEWFKTLYKVSEAIAEYGGGDKNEDDLRAIYDDVERVCESMAAHLPASALPA